MLEVIKIAIEGVKTAWEIWTGASEQLLRHRKGALGRDVFRMYFYGIEIVRCAGTIVDKLEGVAALQPRHLEKIAAGHLSNYPEPEYPVRLTLSSRRPTPDNPAQERIWVDFGELVGDQLQNIKRFLESFDDLAEITTLIDGRFALDATNGIARKRAHLDFLRDLSRRSNEYELLVVFDGSAVDDRTSIIEMDQRNRFAFIPNDKLVRMARHYLETERPREKVAELEQLLEGLRAKMESFFSMPDVLVALNERRGGIT